MTSPEAAGGGVTELYAAYPGEQADNSGGGSVGLLRKLGPIVVPDNETDGLARESSEQNSVSAGDWTFQRYRVIAEMLRTQIESSCVCLKTQPVPRCKHFSSRL